MTVCTNSTRRDVIKGLAACGVSAAVTLPANAATPDERIQAAITELEDALRAKYPNWKIFSEGPRQIECNSYYTPGQPRTITEGILIVANEPSTLRFNFDWQRNYLK